MPAREAAWECRGAWIGPTPTRSGGRATSSSSRSIRSARAVPENDFQRMRAVDVVTLLYRVEAEINVS